MGEFTDSSHTNDHDTAKAGRFLRIFGWCVAITALVVASVNLIAYRFMLEQKNQTIVQLLAGWGRMYKPILYDEIKPQVAVYGASWARDAFDPEAASQIIGLSLFNHAVSGGTPYETRRFADSSVDNPNLQAAIVNLNTFYRSAAGARVRYGFDESILDVDPEHNPNQWVPLKRTYSLALTGWAVGANLKLISTIMARDNGVPRAEYLEAYEQADHTRRSGRMRRIRERIFPDPGAPTPDHEQQSTRYDQSALNELETIIDGFCANRVDVIAFYTPSHVRQQKCDVLATEQFATLALLRRKQTTCDARISYYDFSYPNAVTLEGVLSPITNSEYYRPDGHPRPTIGTLMAARMFGRKFPPDTPALIEQDFGIDLLSAEDPESWLLERAARCQGDWGIDGYKAYQDVLLAE